jgi:hypothetical protein
MSGDYTRVTAKASRNYAGVLQQQGRVTLDADWNENVHIQERRWRAETVDLRGRCWLGDATPDAFRIEAAADGSLTIGAGRLYVDGLLAENHGAAPPDAFDTTLAEARSARAVPYQEQPYRFDTPAPSGAGPRTDLLYLDVWQREVTALQDADLREKALGGPDTATRLQTVWQVRVLEDVGSIGCGEALEAWDALLAAPSGRLTTSVAPEEAERPCLVAAAAGYLGLENQLYRVEIHRPGPPGVAGFKWSRDNASVQARVESISSDRMRITVSSVGRDSVLRFDARQWIEVLDDALLLEGRTGHLVRIDTVDPVSRVLTLETALPAGLGLDAGRPERNTRVVAWNQQEDLDADGLLTAGAGPVPLERGIRVEFGPAGGEFRVGDYWVFAARTADGSVEPLEEAPPRGIHHHHCRLALVERGADGTVVAVSDCRPRAEEEGGCCDVVVQPGESIQAAIDSLPEEGGAVCLKPGTHAVTEPIRISSRSHVTLHGETRGARIERRNGHRMLVIGQDDARTEDVVVRSIEFVSPAANAEFDGAFLTIRDAAGVRVEDCLLEQRGIVDLTTGSRRLRFPMPAFGIAARGCEGLTVRGNTLAQLSFGIVAQDGARLTVVDNHLPGPTLEGTQDLPVVLGSYGVFVADDEAPRIERNRVDDYAVAIGVETAEGGRVVVRDNRVGDALGDDRGAASAEGVAIAILAPTLATQAHLDVSANHIRSAAGRTAISCRSLRGGRIHSNRTTGGEVGVLLSGCDDVNLAGNEILDTGTGIVLQSGARLDVTGNVVAGTRFAGLRGSDLEGCRVAGGLFRNCGWTQLDAVTTTETAAIHLRSEVSAVATGSVTVEACRIVDAGVNASGVHSPRVIRAVRVAGWASCAIRANEIECLSARSGTARADTALAVGGPQMSRRGGSLLDISSNRIVVTDAVQMVDVDISGLSFDRATFTGNHCVHSRPAARTPSVRIQGVGAAIIANNHVTGPAGVVSIECPGTGGGGGGRRTVLGNVTSGRLVVGGDIRPADLAGFNLSA